MGGKYRICLDTDAFDFGGLGRVMHDAEHFTDPGGPVTWVGPYEQEPRPCAMKVLSPARSAQVYFKIPEVEDPMAAAKRMAGVSEFREVRVSSRDESGEHREFAAQGAGGGQQQQFPPQRRQVIDTDNIDPDFAPKTGMNSPSFFPRDAPEPPAVGSSQAYAPPVRKQAVDPADIDPDFAPKGGSQGAPPRDSRPTGGQAAPPTAYQPPKRKEIIDTDNIDPDFR
jgi:hypothetical protein